MSRRLKCLVLLDYGLQVVPAFSHPNCSLLRLLEDYAICSHIRLSVFPTPLHGLPDSLRILLPIVLVEITRLHVRRRRRIRIIQQTARTISTLLHRPSPRELMHVRCLPLYRRQDGGHIIRGAPAVLQYIQTQLAGAVNIWMKHLANELDARRLVGVLLFEVHDEAEGAVFEGRVRGADDDGVPIK